MNYIGDHPLNLIGKVAIVTSAASPIGAAICRELLNSNANVLGIDSIPAHKTTNAQLGSHFQFFQYSQGSSFEGKAIIEHANKMYMRNNIDFLVDVVTGETEDSVVEIIRELVNVMQRQGNGLVLNVLAGNAKDVNAEKQALEGLTSLLSQINGKGVRCNVVVPHDISSSESAGTAIDERTKVALKEHIEAHSQRREKGGHTVDQDRDLANLVLFLCTRSGNDVSGAVIGSGGVLAGT